MNQKRILILQDLSALGRSSLVPAISVTAAMGHQCVPLPTAVFSGHCGIPGWQKQDLTGWLERALTHYRTMNLTVDALLTGYLGSADQIDCVTEAAALIAPDGGFVVDPVMGDNGRLYEACAPLADRMGELCHKARVITPNVTESAVLLGRDPSDAPSDPTEAEHWAEALHRAYQADVVMTGLSFEPDRLTVLTCTDRGCRSLTHARIRAGFPGTGDLFAAVLCGGLVRGDALFPAAARAAGFVRAAIARTAEETTDPMQGVHFESCLHLLTEEVS